MKKPENATGIGPRPVGVSDPRMMASLPHLVEYLTCDKWEDGTARQVSSITIFVDEGMLKASLNDKELQRSLFRTSNDLLSLFEALEAAVGQGDAADWRTWKNAGKRRK